MRWHRAGQASPGMRECFPGREQPALREGAWQVGSPWLAPAYPDPGLGEGRRCRPRSSPHILPAWWEQEPAPLAPHSPVVSPYRPPGGSGSGGSSATPPPAQQKGIQGFGAQWPRVQILHTCNPMSLCGGWEKTEMEGSRNPKPRAWPMNARDKRGVGGGGRRAPPMFLLRVLLDLCLQPHPASRRSLPQE